MGGTPYRSVIFNAREELLSGDVNRAQQVLAKALLDTEMADQVDSNGNAINCFVRAPTVAGVAATFNSLLGAGEARAYDATGVGADDSPWRVLLIPAGAVTHSAPDPGNPRIDLIVATPGTVSSDSSVRNILTDPVGRTFAPSAVYKTSTPTATISVVAGTAAASPVPPAVPAGKVALFEVFVPAAAADATSFGYIKRLHRRAGYPFAGGEGFALQTGILRGCELAFVSAGAGMGISGTDHAVLIDGEVIEFSQSLAMVRDTLADPLAVAAGANEDVPYYLYLAGGRALPQMSANVPVVLIASLTAPNTRTGRPTAALGSPRGSTSSACFVGCGWKKRATAQTQDVKYVGNVAYANGTYFEVNKNVAGPGTSTVTMTSAPTISDFLRVNIAIDYAAAAQLAMDSWNKKYLNPGGAAVGINDGTVDVRILAQQFSATLTVITQLSLSPYAYRIPIRRLG